MSKHIVTLAKLIVKLKNSQLINDEWHITHKGIDTIVNNRFPEMDIYAENNIFKAVTKYLDIEEFESIKIIF